MLITLRLHFSETLPLLLNSLLKFLLRSLNPRFLQLQRSPDRYSSTRFSNLFKGFQPEFRRTRFTFKSTIAVAAISSSQYQLLRARNTDNSNSSTLLLLSQQAVALGSTRLTHLNQYSHHTFRERFDWPAVSPFINVLKYSRAPVS